MVACAVLTSMGAYFVGIQQMPYAAMLYAVVGVFGFLALKRRWAISLLVMMGIMWAVVVTLHDFGAVGFNGWVFIMGVVTVTVSFVACLV